VRIALGLVALLALCAGLGAALLGREDGPAEKAARLVPSSALAYVHLSTDRERGRDLRLARLAGALPVVARARGQVAATLAPAGLDSERALRPWLGDEVAYAVLTPADSVVLAAVADRPRAEARLARADLADAERYRGTRVRLAGDTAIAFAGGFLAVGTEAAVHAVIDRSQGAGERLDELQDYRDATADLPDARSVDAYMSAAGVRTLLAARDGLPGAVGELLERPGLTAVAASLTAEPRTLRARVRLSGGATGGTGFEPQLMQRLPDSAAAYFGIRGAQRLVALLERLGAGTALEELGGTLADDAGIDFERDVLEPLSGELAFGLTDSTTDPATTSAGAPVVTLRAASADPRRTGTALARLQQPLARRLAIPGTVPAFQPLTIGGLDAFTLRVTPELAPTYALADGALIASTAPSGLEPAGGTLTGAPAFEETVGDVPDQADSLVFVDLRALFALGEQTGLTAIPGLATARDDLGRVRAAGAVIAQDPSHPSDTTAELALEIQ
jgi:hypothetical protein